MSPSYSCPMFRGKRILLVGTESLFPLTIFQAMERRGAEIVGPVSFLEDVLILAEDCSFDGAILDSRMYADDRCAIHWLMDRKYVPTVEACRSANCGGKGGCYRLSEAESDLDDLVRALFGEPPTGPHPDRYCFSPARRRHQPAVRARVDHSARGSGIVRVSGINPTKSNLRRETCDAG